MIAGLVELTQLSNKLRVEFIECVRADFEESQEHSKRPDWALKKAGTCLVAELHEQRAWWLQGWALNIVAAGFIAEINIQHVWQVHSYPVQSNSIVSISGSRRSIQSDQAGH